ncbi:unnamed protein product [Leptidea sinapis]|uniref:G-protein coupled receptors family 1 profile domain-containing protein n=1 Tax=Leptidea sinapis TaxID=189913 RepID=A0A5E4QDG0_9NEOP|nr:unnamed protein product [Leptidea sinapis]
MNHGDNKRFGPKPSQAIISACWVAGAGVGLLPLFGWHAAVGPSPGCYFVEVMDYNYLLFLYFATIMSAVVTVEGGQGRAGTMLRVLGAAQKREVKATQNLAIIVFFFIVCWIPLYTINAIKAFMPQLDIPNPLTYFCIIVSHLNSAINPLLYAYHLKDFRAALKGLLCTIIGRGVPLPAVYRPPVPMRRPALERCNALRERPKIYVNSPVWLRQKEAERVQQEKKCETATTAVADTDLEPFISKSHNNSKECYSSDGRDNIGPFLIETQHESQNTSRKIGNTLRRSRNMNAENS